MLIRYLKEIELHHADKKKMPTGNHINEYTLIGKYRVQKQTLEDSITATIYGANISKMLRIATPKHDLESFLIPKVDNKKDNISQYYIYDNGVRYKIVVVRDAYIDIERI